MEQQQQSGAPPAAASALEAGPLGLALVLGFAAFCFASGWFAQVLIDHLAAR
jgi:hypothetical protein